MDRGWRERAVTELELPRGGRVIDLCTGTADVALAIARRDPVGSVVGVDFAGEMLRRGLDKVREAGFDRRIRLLRGDATKIPLADASCDAATIAFGIRNVADPAAALAELARVLRPGARLAILEFGQPRIPGFRALYTWYFKYLLPRVGKAVSKHGHAYSYLPASVGTFPPPAEFARIVASQGFHEVRPVPLTLGIVYLYIARRR
jgi:demethylmenaquinone methyltransferase / 2-methoxy-6-polyprenyl-1,4-benzoquinol methylase